MSSGEPARIPRILRLVLTGCLLLTRSLLGAQDYYATRPAVVEDLIEQIARESEQELDYNTLLEDFDHYMEYPLNLNTATKEKLERLHLLTDFQILSLQKYIRENGPLLSIYELPLVYGFNESIARSLEPLVRTSPPGRELQDGRPEGTHQLLMRLSSVLEEQKGYSGITDSALAASPNARYLGSRLRIRTKYRYRAGNKWLIAYNADKDPGEPFFRGDNRKGFDFNSVCIQANDVWRFKRIVAGDYQVKAGQGLSLWSGLAFGKSPSIVNIRKRGEVLNPYTSVDENRFMRGAAATVALGDFELSGFYSLKRIDANTETDSLSPDPVITSFQSTGYHRTPGEFEDRDAIRESVGGGNVAWNRNRVHLGATFLHYAYDAAVKPLPEPFSPPGSPVRSNTNAGVDYTLGLNRLILFGEASYSLNGGEPGFLERSAILNGAILELHPQVSMSLLHRYMGAGYNALYGNAFRENPANSNEDGLYMGIEIDPYPHWTISGYLDAYRFPYLSDLIADGNSGFDCHLQAGYTDRDKLNAYLRYRYKKRPESLNEGELTGATVPVPHRSQLRFHISYRLTDALSFQDRLELSFYEKDVKEKGWLAFHDILFKPPAFPLSFSFRYSMFDTDGYYSRIYTYEHDVLYAFSIPFWYGRGIRTYLNTRWQIGRHADLWFKYALSWYPDRETISSGLNEIPGRHRQDVNMQVRLRF